MIKHVCDLCGKDICLNSSTNIYKIPFFEKFYATNQGKKIADFTVGIKPKEVELCPSCITNIAFYTKYPTDCSQI